MPLIIPIQRREGIVPGSIVKQDDAVKVKLLDRLTVGVDEITKLGRIHGSIANLEVSQLGEVHLCANRSDRQGRHGRSDLMEELLISARRRKQGISREGNGTGTPCAEPSKG